MITITQGDPGWHIVMIMDNMRVAPIPDGLLKGTLFRVELRAKDHNFLGGELVAIDSNGRETVLAFK